MSSPFFAVAEIVMPVPHSPTHRSLTLTNGLRVVLCSAPWLKRCAAALRVAAGSHDVPPQWPGLAHFLEHLFFLGTERFPAGQNLMTYVQRHGGQVNASTRERTTDFFFELPPAVFAGGLERLCEMLVHPRMSKADQLREREVLHAEFIAWARDDASRNQLNLLQPLSAIHPLRWFHAGNRFSLPVPRPAFQQALQDFYRTFYQAGQMTLSLAGPQPLDELQAVATVFGGYFAKGSKVGQLKPPALVDDQAVQEIQTDPRRLHLVFPCEGLPAGHEQAAAFLCTWMNNAQAGGLIAQLRDRELINSLKAEVLYEFAGQALLDVEVVLTDAIACLPTIRPTQTAEIHRLIFSWLTFFKAHHRQLLDEYTQLETRRLAVLSALPLARHYSASTCKPGLTDQATHALEVLLDTLVPPSLLQAAPQLPKAACEYVEWRLPRPNPFLYPPQAHYAQTPAPAALTFSDSTPATDEGTLYLRWTLSDPQSNLHRMLNDSLQTLIADAGQAGVSLAFSAYGHHWQLKVSGLAEPLPAILEQALNRLSAPDSQTRTRYGQSGTAPAPIPIRQLLNTLPDHFLNSPCSAPKDDLHSVWETARWVGFATGIQDANRPALIHALRATPGTPDDQPITLPACTTKLWATEPSDSSEQALMMFYPTPSASIEDEAMWRFFAHVVQGPFYQRLRVELQLGYAVFSGFRQIAGHGGMLFGVQSPNASATQLVEHITTFMETLPGLVETVDIPAQRSVLQDQVDPLTMDTRQATEMLWQAHLAGHTADYMARLQHSLAHLHLDRLLESARRITRRDAPIFGLSSPSNP